MPNKQKEVVPIHVNLEHKENKSIILGYLEVDTFSAAQKYIQDSYPDYNIVLIEQGVRQKL